MSSFCPLASGSKGNSVFFSSGRTKILIDAGLSGKATIERLAQIGVDISEIQAILISHEHTDHIRGLPKLANRLGISVLANAETAKAIIATLKQTPAFKIFTTGESFIFGDIEVHPFSIQHDAADPVAFTLTVGDTKFGFCTDLGIATSLVTSHLQNCHYLYLEANHHPPLVHSSPRPPIYKQRVLSRSGHLSNQECASLLKSIAHPDLRHVHLAHLSEECNTPDTALAAFDEFSFPLTIVDQHTVGTTIAF